MPVLSSRAQVDDLIAEINAEVATIDAGSTTLIATLEGMATRYAILRDLKFPEDTTIPGYLLINAGGPAYGDWLEGLPGGFITDGLASQVAANFITRNDPLSAPIEVLRTFVQGWATIVISLPADRYEFGFNFADPVNDSTTDRIFDLYINGDKFLSNYDPIAAAGGVGHAAYEPIIYEHAGGIVTITAQASVGSTLLNGLWIDVSVAAVTPPIGGAPSVPSGSFLAEYFTNPTFAAPASVIQNEPYPISHAWTPAGLYGGAPFPGFPNEFFSVRYRGNFTFDAAEDYVFTILIDDEYDFYVDGVLEGSSHVAQTATEYQHTVNMPGGASEIRIDMIQRSGSAAVGLSWGKLLATGATAVLTSVQSLDGAGPNGRIQATLNGLIDRYFLPAREIDSGIVNTTLADLTGLTIGALDTAIFFPDGSAGVMELMHDGTNTTGLTGSTVGAGTSFSSVGGKIVLDVGNQGGYKQSRFLTAIAGIGDGAFGFSFDMWAGEGYGYLFPRASNDWGGTGGENPTNGLPIGIETHADGIGAIYIFDNNGDPIGTPGSFTPEAGAKYFGLVIFDGPTVQFRIWKAVGGSYGNATLTSGSVAYTTAGSFQVRFTGGSAAVQQQMAIYDFWFLSGSTIGTVDWFPYYFTASGGSQTSGALAAVENFDGVDGTLPALWEGVDDYLGNPDGYAAILGNILVITTSGVGGQDYVSYVRRLQESWPANVGHDVLFQVSRHDMDGPSFWLRDFLPYEDGPHGGYYLKCGINDDTISLNWRDGIATGPQPHGTYGNLSSAPFTWVANTDYYLRYQVVSTLAGQLLSVYVGTTPYVDTTTTPWTLEATDTLNRITNPGDMTIFNGDHGAGLGTSSVRVYSFQPYIAVAPTSGTPPAGNQFYIVDGIKIYDGDDNQWSGPGVTKLRCGWNLLGSNVWWDRITNGMSPYLTLWNNASPSIIRMNCGPFPGAEYNGNNVPLAISEFTGDGHVVLIEAHIGTGAYGADESNGADIMYQLISFYTQMAEQYIDNPYVWFSVPHNEPGSGGDVPLIYLTNIRTIIDAIRGTGNVSMISVAAAAWGQDAGDWSSALIQTSRSGILTYGPTILAEYGPSGTVSQGPLCFEPHIYDQWVSNSAARLNDYLDRCAAANLPIIIGETSYRDLVWNLADFSGAVDALITICRTRGIPIIFWHGQGRPPEGSNPITNDVSTGPNCGIAGIDRIDGVIPGNLSDYGTAVWQAARV